MSYARIIVLTSAAMIAFAGNSLLCRAALKHTGIDAAAFTTIRIVSGAFMLWLLMRMRIVGKRRVNVPESEIAGVDLCRREGKVGQEKSRDRAAFHLSGGSPSRSGKGSWISAFALFVYAAGFSFAYVRLPAATGALLLFGAVQATMISRGIWAGERLRRLQLVGFALACGGLVGLLLPGLSAPPLYGSAMMLSAGVAWGIYSLRGRGAGDPTSIMEGNFLRAVPFAAILSVLMFGRTTLDNAGVWYAVSSGALASGVGYAIWYMALPALKVTTAATVQLSVPVIAALGGIVFLNEAITLRLSLAAAAILGGIALVILENRNAHGPKHAAPEDRP